MCFLHNKECNRKVLVKYTLFGEVNDNLQLLTHYITYNFQVLDKLM